MSLYKQPKSQFWWCLFRINGKPFRRSTGEVDRKQAEKAERRLRAAAESQAEELPRRRRGVGGLSKLGAADVDRSRAEATADASVARVEAFWTILLAHFGADIDPIDITSDKVFAFVRARKERGLLNQTIRRELQALMRGLKDAHQRGWIASTPTPWPKLKSDPPGNRRGKLHGPDVLKAIFDNVPDVAREGIELVLATGLRDAELHRVRASWVRPVAGGSKAVAVLRLPEGFTKNRKSRSLGLNEEACAIIKRRAKVFGDEIFPPYGYTQAMKRVAKKLGRCTTCDKVVNLKSVCSFCAEQSSVRRVPLESVTLRDLRHTYASNGLKGSGNLSAVGGALGHSALEITTIYLHAERQDVLDLAGTVIIPARSYLEPKKKPGRLSAQAVKEKMARGTGVEPVTFGFGGQHDRENITDTVSAHNQEAEDVIADRISFDHTCEHTDFPDVIDINELFERLA